MVTDTRLAATSTRPAMLSVRATATPGSLTQVSGSEGAQGVVVEVVVVVTVLVVDVLEVVVVEMVVVVVVIVEDVVMVAVVSVADVTVVAVIVVGVVAVSVTAVDEDHVLLEIDVNVDVEDDAVVDV